MAYSMFRNLKLVYGTHKMVDGINYGIVCGAIDTATGYGNEELIQSAISKQNSIPIIITKFNSQDFENGIEEAISKHISKLGYSPQVVMLHSSFGSDDKNLNAYHALQRYFPDKILGVSNFSKNEIKYLINNNCKPEVVQVEYHPKFQPKFLVKYCQENEILVMAYRPFAKGELLNDPKIKNIAEKLDSTPAQVILKWLQNKDIIPVASSNSEEHIITNLFNDTPLTYTESIELTNMNIGKSGSTCMVKYCDAY